MKGKTAKSVSGFSEDLKIRRETAKAGQAAYGRFRMPPAVFDAGIYRSSSFIFLHRVERLTPSRAAALDRL